MGKGLFFWNLWVCPKLQKQKHGVTQWYGVVTMATKQAFCGLHVVKMAKHGAKGAHPS